MSRKNKKLESKLVGTAGGISGTGSIISAHNVCHTLCLSVVAILSIFGIVVSSTALFRRGDVIPGWKLINPYGPNRHIVII